MIEYQKEELEEARRMAAAATAPAGSNAPPSYPPPHDLQGSLHDPIRAKDLYGSR